MDRGLVWRYYLYRVTTSAGFYVPIAVLYLRDEGYGLGFVGVAYAVYGVASLAAEIPTGYLGDWLGRRASLAVGAVTRAVVLGLYPLVEGATAILALHVLWAVGRTFRSGTEDAWLYELLAAHLDEDQFARVQGRGSTALLVVSAAGAVAGGLLYTTSQALPFLVNAVLSLSGVPVLYTFDPVGGGDDDGDAFGVREAVGVLRAQVGRPEVRWLVAYAAVFQAVFLVTRIYEQPALDAVGVPVAGLGVLYAGFKLVSAGAAATAGWFQDRLGTRGVFALLVPLYAVAYGAIAVAPWLLVPALFLNRGRRTVTTPVRNQYLNDRLADVGRATVLSGASMVLAAAGVVARLSASVVADSLGAVGLLPVTGLLGATLAVFLWLSVSPVRGDGAALERATPAD